MSAADESLYGDLAFFHTHPGHLAAVAALCGLPRPPVEACRVLELACGTGFNLIAMSQSLPRGTFVGVDLSAKQIQHGAGIAAVLGATTVDLRAGRLEEVDARFGEFDYVIAHGIFSWAPPDVQRALLRVVRDRLAPTGIGYVSYNTLPGWGFRGLLRDAMRLLEPADAPPGERVRRTKEAVGQLIEGLPGKDSLYQQVLRAEAAAIADDADYYVLGEHLAENNRPMLFTEFAAMLADAGLQYVAESRYATSSFAQTGDDATALDAVGDDLIRREQLHDVRWQRYFRQSLVCHAGRTVPRAPDEDVVKRLWLTARVELVDPVAGVDDAEFDTVRRLDDGQTWPVSDPLYRRLLRRLHRTPGRALPATAFVLDAREAVPVFATDAQFLDLVAQVMAYGARDELWNLTAAEPRYTTDPGERPLACPLARHQAAGGAAVTNRLHRTSKLTDPDRELLLRLDGTATRDDLAAALAIDRGELDARLARLVAAAVVES